MEGKTLKAKIKAKKIKLKDVAAGLGMSPQNFQAVLNSPDVRSSIIERVAKVIGEPVCYFYNELPILGVEDYAKVKLLQQEVKHLKELQLYQQFISHRNRGEA